jgi:drug/metabolite transporter (DMT)-like permease
MTAQTPPHRHDVLKGNATLLLCAFLWGMAFTAQRSGMSSLGPFFFNGIRELLGVLTLLLVIAVLYLVGRAHSRRPFITMLLDSGPTVGRKALLRRHLLVGGGVTGVVLFCAASLQQCGLVYTGAGKGAFITAMYIVLVPIAGIFLHRRLHWNTWAAIGLAVVGLYLLCVSDGTSIALGDLLMIGCALFWTCHILVIDHYVKGLSWQGVLLFSAISFLVCGILSLICAPFLDNLFVQVPLTWGAIMDVAPEILYAGVISSGIAFTLQAIGQKFSPPAIAAIIMSLESAFGLLGGAILLHEVMSGSQYLGCLCMLGAVILAQLVFKRRSNLR